MPNTILVAEDNLDSRQITRLMLETQGYNVLEAEDGYEAVYVASRNEIDLIIMDMSMPQMDGINAAKILKKDEERRHIPIIALTAFGNFYEEHATEAGIDAFLTKPFDMTVLLETIERFVNQSNGAAYVEAQE